MCNSVTSADSVLPTNISRDDNAVIHLCFDNFDLNKETPSGSGTTHSTHGIVIKEVLNPDRQHILPQTHPTPRSKERSVKPVEVEIRPCFANLKVEPNLDIETSTVEFSFEASEFDNFA